MKAQRKNLPKFTFWTSIMTLVLLGSCGKPSNNVAGPGVSGSSLFYQGSPGFSSSPQIVTHVMNIKNGVQCQSPNTRLAQDTTFYVSGNFPNGTSIGGSFTPGVLLEFKLGKPKI